MDTDSKFSEKEIDAALRELFQSQKLKKAPAFFTDKVMHKVQQEKVVVEYKPVISRRTWGLIGVFILAILVFGFFQPSASSKALWTLPNFSVPPIFESLNHWMGTLTSGGWQWMHTSGLLLPLLALFLALSLHFILLSGFDIARKNKLDKMYCL